MGLRDYLQVVKPRIIPLLVFVALGSTVIAAKGIPSTLVLIGVLLGGTLASSGSLAFNSYLEMGIDSKMQRTKNRPLPAQRIVPPTTHSHSDSPCWPPALSSRSSLST
jgi:protoheme IX farnesyltransferase